MDFKGEKEMMWFTEYYLDEGGIAPSRGYPTDAGIDIKTPVDIYMNPNDSVVIDTKLHVLIPEGCVGFIKSKSGLNVKEGITTEGVIDAGYTGSIVVKLYSHEKELILCRGEKIAQLVILPIETEQLKEISKDRFEREANRISQRASNGFGSTGR